MVFFLFFNACKNNFITITVQELDFPPTISKICGQN